MTARIAMMACLAALLAGCAAAPSPAAAPGRDAEPICASTATPGWPTDPRLVTDNDVRGFVYQFFGWFDRNADPCLSTAHLSTSDLLMRFPEETLTGVADYRRWYDGVLRTVASANHEVSDLSTRREDADHYTVRLSVRWRAALRDGGAMDQTYRHEWRLAIGRDRMLIERYLVSPV